MGQIRPNREQPTKIYNQSSTNEKKKVGLNLLFFHSAQIDVKQISPPRICIWAEIALQFV